MDNNNDRNSAVVPIRAHLAGIEVVGDLEGPSTSERRDYFVVVSVDGREVARSLENKSGQPAPRWEWPADHEFLFHPSLTINIKIHRESRTRIGWAKHRIGKHTGRVDELLDNDATIDLKDKAGVGISSGAKIKVNLSLVPQPEDTFKDFMESVDANVSRLENILANAGSPALDVLNGALQLTKNVMDIVAGTHPILKASWTVFSAVYTAVQQAQLLDDAVRALAKNLRETLGVAKEKPDLLVIAGTDNVIEEIGRTSLRIALLICEYTRLRFAGRVIKYQIFNDMQSRIADCQQSCTDLKEKFDRRVNLNIDHQLKIIKNDQLARDIRQWLSAPDSSKNFNDARKKHQEGTCSWFLDGKRFGEFQEKGDFLWIKGKAGSGKTILCSSIIEKIDRFHKETPSVKFAYFFFDGRDEQKDLQLHDKLIRSLVFQLSRQCDGIPAALVELHGGGYQQPSTKSLERVLYDLISGMPSVYIIIDSLDECSERQELLEWIEGIFSRKISTLHMVVVSRPERDIEDAFRPLDARCCIDLAKESESDIMIYIEQQLLVLQKWDKETRNIVKSTLAEQSEGMFRWVALQLTDLQDCPDEESVIAQLRNLPTDLYKTYDRILLKVSKPGRNDTKTFLRWLCFSVRPMTLAEIADAVTIDLDAKDGPQYTPTRRYFDKKDVLNKCSSLIIESEGTIKLAHFSVKEYLLSDLAESPGPLLNFHLTSAELCHSLISQTCLAYLLQFDADDSVDNTTAVSHRLAPYAAEHWISHAKAGGIDSSEPSWTLTLATRLFTHLGAVFGNWLQIWDLDDPYKIWMPSTTGSSLYYASLAGLQQLCLHLLKKEDPNAQGGRYGNVLQAASYQGHDTIVQLLLEKGADLNTQGGRYGNALQAASYEGHEAIVQLLLENSADPNAQGGEYGNALYAASFMGHDTIAQLLLEKGADPNAQGGEYGNALQAASLEGYDTIVQLLLEKGADPNAQGGEYSNALQVASHQGCDTIVHLLLEKGADPNAQGGEYSNALQAASFEGYDTIVWLLLEKGADPNAQGGIYGNALEAASHKGREAIVQLLLEMGADPNAKGGKYGNALQAASCQGYDTIVQLLLKKGTDPNAHGGEYSNALYAASSEGNQGIVQLLLEMGADPNAKGGKYGNALQAASCHGYDTIVQLLLEKGTDPNAQGGEYSNALYAASSEGNQGIVQLLLEKGADPNAQGGLYDNALQAASCHGYDTIVQLLLEKGADPNAQGGYYGNALYVASSQGDEAIVQLLLENGADPNAQGGLYDNALQAASCWGHGAIVQLLLEWGAHDTLSS